MATSNSQQLKNVGYIEFWLPDWISLDVCGLVIKSWCCLVWRSCLVWSGNCNPILLGVVCLSDAPIWTSGRERWGGIFRRGMILGNLVSGSPMMWVTGVLQVLHQHNQLLEGESGLPTMEMSYWHALSSLNMYWRWRAPDLSWQFHCSHNSLMAQLPE